MSIEKSYKPDKEKQQKENQKKKPKKHCTKIKIQMNKYAPS